jgi:hypothetical protein
MITSREKSLALARLSHWHGPSLTGRLPESPASHGGPWHTGMQTVTPGPAAPPAVKVTGAARATGRNSLAATLKFKAQFTGSCQWVMP